MELSPCKPQKRPATLAVKALVLSLISKRHYACPSEERRGACPDKLEQVPLRPFIRREMKSLTSATKY
jgi:hypothetical protein